MAGTLASVISFLTSGGISLHFGRRQSPKLRPLVGLALGAAVADGDYGIVVRVDLPHAALPVQGQLIGEGRLRSIVKRLIVASGDGHDLVGQPFGG